MVQPDGMPDGMVLTWCTPELMHAHCSLCDWTSNECQAMVRDTLRDARAHAYGHARPATSLDAAWLNLRGAVARFVLIGRMELRQRTVWWTRRKWMIWQARRSVRRDDR